MNKLYGIAAGLLLVAGSMQGGEALKAGAKIITVASEAEANVDITKDKLKATGAALQEFMKQVGPLSIELDAAIKSKDEKRENEVLAKIAKILGGPIATSEDFVVFIFNKFLMEFLTILEGLPGIGPKMTFKSTKGEVKLSLLAKTVMAQLERLLTIASRLLPKSARAFEILSKQGITIPATAVSAPAQQEISISDLLPS